MYFQVSTLFDSWWFKQIWLSGSLRVLGLYVRLLRPFFLAIKWVIKIWSEYKYGKCDPEIVGLLNDNLPDLYLLASPEILFEEDPQRENPDNRDELFLIYKAEITKLNIPCIVLKGSESVRLEKAMEIFSNYFN